jgi:hypothetical protein
MRTLGTAFAVVLVLAPSISQAMPEACNDSYEQAQLLRKEGKLLKARDQLRICSQPSCPSLMVADCTRWEDEAVSSLPSVVPVAVDEAGVNLINVQVSLDGVPLSNAPAGQAIDLDAGMHHFAFARADLTTAEADVLVAIGQKNRPVQVTMRRLPAASEVRVAPDSPAASPAEAPPPAARWSPLKIAGFVGGAVGVVGLGVGGAFAAEAKAEQRDAGCPGNVCRPGSNPGALRDALTDANVATALFIGGGVLAAAGITTWLVAPSRHTERAAWVGAAPVAARNGGGLVLLGGW